MDAREAALLALNDCQRQGGWSDAILKKRLASAGLDSRDGALATQLCFGVLQNRLLLDFYLSHFSNLPLKRMEGRVVETLRLGAYQMLFLDKIPHSAAVNVSVELTRKHCKNPRAAGMVNGILRNLERNLGGLPTVPQTDPVSYLSTLYSHPEWLVRELLTALGCTEPIAIAFGAANARKLLGAIPQELTVECSGNLIKNAKAVVVPMTVDLRGIEAAAILGAVGGDPSRDLEVLTTVTGEDLALTKELLARNICQVHLLETPAKLHIIVENGVNLMAVSRSIMSEVRYNVSRYTGVTVRTVDVYIDSMVIA